MLVDYPMHKSIELLHALGQIDRTLGSGHPVSSRGMSLELNYAGTCFPSRCYLDVYV